MAAKKIMRRIDAKSCIAVILLEVWNNFKLNEQYSIKNIYK